MPNVVIFDVGNVLYDWNPRFLYERLIADDRALDAFLRDVATKEWHFQHDAGRPFAETSAELAALYPHYEDLIAVWGPRFTEQLGDMLPGMREIVTELDARSVPLYAITNFSGEFWGPFRAREADIFDRFRDVVVSGDEKIAKPDPAIYHLALARFGVAAGDAVFIDDRADNVEAADGVGIRGVLFEDAAKLRGVLSGYGLL
ncbi:HAD family hydrolase [Sphingomonas immobilis]|uniref:HAD family phosphatase n=1 Tax=Sphingomonas immobilis TaxID=3063997 RepID=A0ABT9A5D0_9SPHN|nr:HAD family phosphatase [Sphingomonas sp. CA1-15]MDO7844637.1 HAD family phosphatase [Sphingomonas sp. CA1-15]